ncbi:TSC22 domain family protein 1-like isoform X2 [Lethenteron reissneri]|uniref:TSC22 domain family protein 1-like isoform X2 n=1 Tax=Lethenteron reissneri TaxID=7753 RepID=UPI002AB66BFF|nr:TSC22 domain family protein 1-like isoform X2 [Lethenteron reissneri]
MAHPSVPRRGSLNTGGLDEGGGSVPGPQHPQQHVHHQQQQQQQQQPSSQSLHMPTKKKSGFQITSVTAAQPNSVAEDTESYDDLDESRTEDISSEILDGSRNADFEPGAYERSSSEETLNNVGEGVDTPALTPVHAQGGVFMVNGGPHIGPGNAAAQGHSAAVNLTAPTRVAPSPAAAAAAAVASTAPAAAPPSSQTVAGPAVAAAFSAQAQPGVASPRAAAAAVPPATPPPAAQAMVAAPVSVATAPSSQVAPSNQQQQQQQPHHHHHHLPVCSSRFRVVKLDTTTEPYKKGRWTCTEYYEKESASLAADASAAAASAAAAVAASVVAAAARNNVNDSMKESGATTLVVAASYNAADAASSAALARVNSLDYGSQQGGINAVNSGVPAAFNKQQGNTVGHNIQQQQLSNVNAFVQSAGGQGSIQTVGMQQVVSASTQPQPPQQPQQMSYAGQQQQQQMGVQPQGQAMMGGSALTQGSLTVTQMPGPAQTGEGNAATMASSQLGGQHPQSTPGVPQPQALGQPAQSIAHQVIHNPAATQQPYIAHQGSVASQVTHQQPQPGQPLGQQTLLGQQQQQLPQVMQQPQPIGQQAQQMGQASMQPQLGQQQQQQQQPGGQQPPVMMVGQQLSQHNPQQSPQVVQQNPMMPQQPPQSPSLVQQQQATSQQLFQPQTQHPIAQQAFPQQSMPTHALSEQQQAINQHNFQQQQQQQPLTQQAQPMTPQQAFSQQPPMQSHVLSEQQQQALSQPAFQQQQQPPMLSDQQSMQQPQASQPVGPPGPVLQPQQQQHAQLVVQPPQQQQQQHGLLPLQQILPVSGLASGAPTGSAAPQPLPLGLQHPLTLGGDLGGYGGSFLPQAAASLLLQHGQQQLSHQQSQALFSLAYSVAQTQHQLPGGHPEDPSGAAAHGEVHGESFAGGIPVIPQLLPMAVGATQGLLESEEESASGASVVAIDNKIEQAMDLVKSHLMYAVREEVEVLKEQIKELIEKNSQLEQENRLLKSLASPEQLQQIQSQIVSVPSGGGGAQPSTPGGGVPAVGAVAAPPAAAAPVTAAPSATALPSV